MSHSRFPLHGTSILSTQFDKQGTVLKETLNEHNSITSNLAASRRALNRLKRRYFTDKILLGLGMAFFLLVVTHVFKRRVGSPFALFYLFFYPSAAVDTCCEGRGTGDTCDVEQSVHSTIPASSSLGSAANVAGNIAGALSGAVVNAFAGAVTDEAPTAVPAAVLASALAALEAPADAAIASSVKEQSAPFSSEVTLPVEAQDDKGEGILLAGEGLSDTLHHTSHATSTVSLHDEL